MATYEFQCTEDGCAGITERIQPMSAKLPETILCRFCGAEAAFKYPLLSVARSGMTPTKTPIDVSIGRDAAARWASIGERQAKRNRVREKTGHLGLAADHYNEFRPLTVKERLRREQAGKAVERDGFRGDHQELNTIADRKPQ